MSDEKDITNPQAPEKPQSMSRRQALHKMRVGIGALIGANVGLWAGRASQRRGNEKIGQEPRSHTVPRKEESEHVAARVDKLEKATYAKMGVGAAVGAAGAWAISIDGEEQATTETTRTPT